MLGRERVLALAGRELFAAVDEEDVGAGLAGVALLARPIEDQDRDRDAGGREEAGLQMVASQRVVRGV